MERYKFDWEPNEKSLRYIEKEYICSREMLLGCIRGRQAYARDISRTDQIRPAAYYSALDGVFEKLIDRVENEVLFDRLEPCWVYSFSVGSHGAEVCLQHIGYIMENEDGSFGSILYNASYELLSIPCKMLSPEEFAQIYGLDLDTVTDWIHCGKIRSVRKTGREWRISELTELPGNSYTPGNFRWQDELLDLPEEFAYLREPSSLRIEQDKKHVNRYNLTIYRTNRLSTEPHVEFLEGLPAKKREKLEMMLLAHPLVKSSSEHETTW